jgi:hypothetical protein
MTSPSFKSDSFGLGCCFNSKVSPGTIDVFGLLARWTAVYVDIAQGGDLGIAEVSLFKVGDLKGEDRDLQRDS